MPAAAYPRRKLIRRQLYSLPLLQVLLSSGDRGPMHGWHKTPWGDLEPPSSLPSGYVSSTTVTVVKDASRDPDGENRSFSSFPLVVSDAHAS